MDHAINALQTYYEVTLEQFIEEHKSNNHESIVDNPYYLELKALSESLNILRQYEGLQLINLNEEIEHYL